MSSTASTIRVQPKSIKEMRDMLDRSTRAAGLSLTIIPLSNAAGLEVRSTTTRATRTEVGADGVVWWKGNRKVVEMSTDYFDVRTTLQGNVCIISFRYRACSRPLAERLSSVRRSKYPTFASRVLGALAELEQELPPERIEEAVSAPNDFSVLLAALSEPAVVTQMVAKDPLAAAKLRGLEKQKEFLKSAGGIFSTEEVAEILGLSRQAVDKRRRQGQLIALAQGRRGYIYPGFQFENGRAIPDLKQVLPELGSHDPWMKCAFFINPNSRLADRSPIQALRTGDVEGVLRAARSYGEQGAA